MSVYDYTSDNSDTEEKDETVISKRYKKVKKGLDFIWWSLKVRENGLFITLDGVELDDKMKEKDANYMFGKVQNVKPVEDFFVQFDGGDNDSCVILALYDFMAFSSEFSKGLHINSTKDFCEDVTMKLENLRELEVDTKIVQVDDTSNSQGIEGCAEEMKMTEDDLDNKEEINQRTDTEKHTANTLVERLNKSVVGEFQLPITSITEADQSRAVRDLNVDHLRDLFTSFQLQYLNGGIIKFPTAAGIIKSGEADPCDIEGGNIVIELVDGNHTHQVMKELKEMYPNEKCFQERKVMVYKGNIDPSLISTLGLLRNEEASNSLKTSNMDKVKLMRRELFTHFEGNFNVHFQDHIYQVFNCLCPKNVAEERRRKKTLQHLLRMSTMNEECWQIVMKINEKYPTHTVFAYRDIGVLTVQQSKTLLNNVLQGHIKLKDLRKETRRYPLPDPATDEELTFQRLRKQQGSKEKRKGSEYPTQNHSKLQKVHENKGDGVAKEQSQTSIGDDIEDLKERNKRLEKNLKDALISLRKEKEHNEHFRQTAMDYERLKSTIEEEAKARAILNKDRNAEIMELQMKLFSVTRERDDLKEKLGKLQSPNVLSGQTVQLPNSTPTKVTNLPFSLGIPLHHSTPIEEEEEKKERNNVVLVEYNNGTIYFGEEKDDHIYYCKAPVGKIKEGKFVNNERRNSYLINKKDKQHLDYNFIIHSFRANINNNLIDKLDTVNFEHYVAQYMGNK